MAELALLNILHLIVLEAAVVVGVLANGFIIVINCFDWLQKKTLTSSDLILFALSLCRLLFLGIIFGNQCYHYLEEEKAKDIPLYIAFFWAFFNIATLWIATCLPVFYCIKIVNFAQPFLVKVKLNLSWIVPLLLLISILAAFVFTLPVLSLENYELCCNKTRIFLNSTNGVCTAQMCNFALTCLLYFTGSFPSFICFFVSSALLIHSLLQHFKRMQVNTDCFQDRMMEAHVKALKTVILLIALYCATFVAEVSSCISYNRWTLALAVMVIVAFNSGHAVIMIIVNPKLKQASTRTLLAIRSLGYYLGHIISRSYPKTSEAADLS